MINKVKDYVNAWKTIHANHKANKYDLIIARSSFAGILAYLFFLVYRIPFVVESFEPHSEYQINIPNGWSKFGIRYLFLNIFEKIQIKYSSLLLPVSINYKNRLIEQGVSDTKIVVQPCCIDYSKFNFSSSIKSLIRSKLNIPNEHLVGIYVGKFGGLYYKDQAFKLIGDLNKFLNKKFSIILLTPNDGKSIVSHLAVYGLEKENIHLLFVKPEEVFDYLTASDFAFNFHISNNVSFFFSPIKNAEYWAMGLPIIIPFGIGDDSDTIDKLDIGIVHNFSQKIKVEQVERLLNIINRPNIRENIREKTVLFRSIDLIYKSYFEMFNKLQLK